MEGGNPAGEGNKRGEMAVSEAEGDGLEAENFEQAALPHLDALYRFARFLALNF